MQESKFFSLFLFLFSFGKHHVVWKDLATYIQLDVGAWVIIVDITFEVNTLGDENYKPLSFHVSGWNFLLMCMRWGLAIIEDYMMVEYVDSPKGSDTRPFLKRWWIVVAKLTENIVCWFSVEFMLLLQCCDELLLVHEKLYDESSMIKFYVKVYWCYNNMHDASMSVFCFYRYLSLSL